MTIKKIFIAGCCAALLATVAAPANAAAYFIGGKWYYFSLNFEALLAKITGKDLKTGTYVGAEVKILDSDVRCANPQGHFIDPGQGPLGTAYGTSPSVDADDLTRTGNKVTGNIYTTTASVVELVPEGQRLNPPADLCKNPPGNATWQPVYWQDRNCSKGLPVGQLTDPVCYRDLAVKVNGALVYITGPYTGALVSSVDNEANWTFTYLPTAFKFRADLINSAAGTYDSLYGSCQFPPNNEAGAAMPGAPYSLSNPPVNGWAADPPVGFDCVQIPAEQY
jgi:hypothetical protein